MQMLSNSHFVNSFVPFVAKSGLILVALPSPYVRDGRGRVRARRRSVPGNVLFGGVAKHLVGTLPISTQRGRLLHFLAILIRITGETRLLPAWF